MSRYVLFFAVAASCAACASILDFQDPTEKLAVSSVGDAGHAAPSTTSSSYSAPLDASIEASTEAGQRFVAHGPIDLCACLPAVTTDWQGPFVVATTTDGSAPAACEGAYPTEAYSGLSGSNAPAAECSCGCGEPTNVTCSTPETTFFGDDACTGSCGSSTTALACTPVTSYSCDLLGLTKPKAMKVAASEPSGGACLPTPKVNVPTATWSSAVRLCGSTTTPACGDAGCAAAPGLAFSDTNRCVTKAGDNACPAAYPAKQLFHQNGTDTRTCTPCTCGAPAKVACTATVSSFSGASCASGAVSLELPTDCVAVTSSTHLTIDSASAQGGSCLATAGTPTGAFTEDAPTTVCCLE